MTFSEHLPAWHLQAACRGASTHLFFPDSGGASVKEAKALCATCPVRKECADWGIAMREPHGIWGGLSERERRTYRSRRVA